MMEKRKSNISIAKPGGTAGKGSLTYRAIMPSAWMQELGITQDDRSVLLSFDGSKITIEKSGQD